MLKTCRTDDVSLDTEGSYQAVLTVVLAIGIIIIDGLISSKRASVSACEALKTAMSSIRASVAHAFDSKEKTCRFHKGTVLGLIDTANSFGNEANEEPRYWRIPWKEDAFKLAVEAIYSIRYNITTIEYMIAQNYKNGGPKNLSFIK